MNLTADKQGYKAKNVMLFKVSLPTGRQALHNKETFWFSAANLLKIYLNKLGLSKRPNFNTVVKSRTSIAAGSGALPKQSGCNAHDKTCSKDFQGIKSKSRVFCFFFGRCKKEKNIVRMRYCYSKYACKPAGKSKRRKL